MTDVQLRDKQFELFIPEEDILKAIEKVAENVTRDMKNDNPLFICVLNGAFMFAADLMKCLDFPCEIGFIRLKSYSGTKSEGSVKEMHGLTENIENRHVVIVEDIIDTGHTMHYLLENLQEKHPASIRIATLLFKPEALRLAVNPDYVALEIPNDFIVGYGLDYDGHGRNLRNIYKIKV
jgi:hypoxanthine phosphoribosyltransferase